MIHFIRKRKMDFKKWLKILHESPLVCINFGLLLLVYFYLFNIGHFGIDFLLHFFKFFFTICIYYKDSCIG